jgi:drug/metabolite transporter (DMT)-like permease
VLLGAILIACGSVSWGLFSVLLQPYTLRAHPLHLSSLTLASGAVVILAAGAPELQALEWGAITATQWGAVLYASIGSLVLAYLLFYRGVRLLGPTKTAMYGNLQPLVALSVAWVMLGEQPSLWQLVGASCIMAGLLISRLSRGGDRPTTSTRRKTA